MKDEIQLFVCFLSALLSLELGFAGLSTGPPASSPRQGWGAGWGSRDAQIKVQSTFGVRSKSRYPAILFSIYWHSTHRRHKRRIALQFLNNIDQAITVQKAPDKNILASYPEGQVRYTHTTRSSRSVRET